MASKSSSPIPGIWNTTSTMSVPPISVPTLSPATVSSVNDEGRRAWRNRMRRVRRPFALAIVMKSCCRVAIMSLRSSRMYTAIWPTASVMAGSTHHHDCWLPVTGNHPSSTPR